MTLKAETAIGGLPFELIVVALKIGIEVARRNSKRAAGSSRTLYLMTILMSLVPITNRISTRTTIGTTKCQVNTAWTTTWITIGCIISPWRSYLIIIQMVLKANITGMTTTMAA